MSTFNIKELKNQCFVQQADSARFSVRIRLAGGTISGDDLEKVTKLARQFGNGSIHLTARQCIEIPHVKKGDIEQLKEEFVKNGLKQGVCGARVRTITACQGEAVCRCGLIETGELAKELDHLYYSQVVPHKFKIGVTGCRNNCLKAEENDLGIKGARTPSWKKELCKFCGICQGICRKNAIEVDKKGKSLRYNKSKCNHCGRCQKSCPFKAWEGRSGYVLYFGGLFGNQIQIGKQLLPVIYDKEILHRVIEKTLEYFRTHGQKGERFGTLLKRTGWKAFKNDIRETLKRG